MTCWAYGTSSSTLRGNKPPPAKLAEAKKEGEFIINHLLVRIHFIIEVIWWTGLAPREYEFPFPGSFISTYLKSKIDLEEFAAEVGVLDMLDRGRKHHHEVQEADYSKVDMLGLRY